MNASFDIIVPHTCIHGNTVMQIGWPHRRTTHQECSKWWYLWMHTLSRILDREFSRQWYMKAHIIRSVNSTNSWWYTKESKYDQKSSQLLAFALVERVKQCAIPCNRPTLERSSTLSRPPLSLLQCKFFSTLTTFLAADLCLLLEFQAYMLELLQSTSREEAHHMLTKSCLKLRIPLHRHATNQTRLYHNPKSQASTLSQSFAQQSFEWDPNLPLTAQFNRISGSSLSCFKHCCRKMSCGFKKRDIYLTLATHAAFGISACLLWLAITLVIYCFLYMSVCTVFRGFRIGNCDFLANSILNIEKGM